MNLRDRIKTTTYQQRLAEAEKQMKNRMAKNKKVN